jgi:hypothetical protein
MPITDGVADYSDLMNRFRRAYGKTDPVLLADVLGDGFEWHNHWFSTDDPNTTGRVIHGIDDMVTELLHRKRHWSDVRFDGIVEHFAPAWSPSRSPSPDSTTGWRSPMLPWICTR